MNCVTLKEKLEKNDQVVLIDCREQDEWDAGHIDGAEFMPLSQFPDEVEKKLMDKKDAEIIMQCRSGKRSYKACQYLQSVGFTNLTNLEGGILDWEAQGYDIKRS